MKAAGIFLLLLVWQTSFSQFTDSFEDGNFTSNPPWSGQTADFSIIDGQLQLAAAPVSASSFLVTSSQSIENAVWEFTVGMAFNPSSSNYAEVYLVADSPELTAEVGGYLVRVGWTSDNICLVRKDGNSKEVIIEGPTKRLDLSNIEIRVQVSRSAIGEWVIQSRLTSEADWVVEGSVVDNTYQQSAYFGIVCNYTSTRADKFYFDEFVVTGEPYTDRQPPVIDSVYSISEKELVVVMSEELAVATAGPGNFLLNGLVPEEVVLANNLVQLAFSQPHRVDNNLEVHGLADPAGNVMEPTSYEFTHYTFKPIQFGDIVFNEILADPTPQVDLPEEEYVEIVNSSQFAIKMTGWSYSDRSTTVVLPELRLKPDSMLILCRAGTANKWSLTNVVELGSWPSLNNSDDELWLRDSSGSVIDYLAYSTGLFEDAAKVEGGWSLERLDPYLPCSGSTNWQGSVHPSGGTPGRLNSVFQKLVDEEAPALVSTYAFAPDSLVLFFSEPLGVVPDISSDGIDIVEKALSQTSKEVILNTVAIEHGVAYTLVINTLTDCIGNIRDGSVATVRLPESPIPGDLVINEILFDPKGDYHDYVEVFNTSSHFISVLGLAISNGATEKGMDSYTIIEPGGYEVITPEPNEIMNNYPESKPETIIHQELPAFTNESGMVVLKDNVGQTIDSIAYDRSWHFGYLNDVEGVALERLSPYREATGPSNWASASIQHNFGTPGYANSQKTNSNTQNVLAVEPQVIVPNADGRDDFTTISVNEKDNSLLTIRIYNLAGAEIRMLANNEPIAGESYFTWDGTDDYGQLVPLGHYFIVADLVYENGRTESFRAKLVVGTGF